MVGLTLPFARLLGRGIVYSFVSPDVRCVFHLGVREKETLPTTASSTNTGRTGLSFPQYSRMGVLDFGSPLALAYTTPGPPLVFSCQLACGIPNSWLGIVVYLTHSRPLFLSCRLARFRYESSNSMACFVRRNLNAYIFMTIGMFLAFLFLILPLQALLSVIILSPDRAY